MPHPDYTLPRELAGALSRCAASAHYLPSWYGTNNAPLAVAALSAWVAACLRAATAWGALLVPYQDGR